jgi:hypothetical protein
LSGILRFLLFSESPITHEDGKSIFYSGSAANSIPG